MTSERVKALEQMVVGARQALAAAERLAQEYARGVHLARTILRQHEEKLAEVKQLEADEAR